MFRVDAGRRRGGRAALLACLLLPAGLWLQAAGAAAVDTARGAEAEARYPGYCAGVQQYLADTRRVARTVYHETRATFARSKPEARPLVVHQYLHEGRDGRPEMISCKTKTADALLHAYGALDETAPAQAAPDEVASGADSGPGGQETGRADAMTGRGGGATTGHGDATALGPAPPQSRRRCRDIALQSLWRVEARLEALGASAAARAARQAFAAPNEPYLMGSSYLAEFPLVEFVDAAGASRPVAALHAETDGEVATGEVETGEVAPGEAAPASRAANGPGVLRINTRSLRVLWEDRRFRMLPKSLRGVHYCHLIAPDYLERLLLSRHPVSP